MLASEIGSKDRKASFNRMTATQPRRSDIAIPTTDDMFLGETLSILQPRKGYRAGIDAVLLAATVPASSQHEVRILDLGSGVGVVGLSVAARLSNASVTLIEHQASLVDLARKNIERNDLCDRATVHLQDIVRHGSQGIAAASYDYAMANPPFYEPSSVRLPPNQIKSMAHAMSAGDLDAWFRLMAHALKPGGFATLIHRVEALPELLQLASGRFGALEIQPIQPFADQPANRIIFKGQKGSRKPLKLLPGIVIHRPDRSYQTEIEQVLRSPRGLERTFE